MEVVLGEVPDTSDLDFTSAWADHTETTFTPAGTDGVTTSVTPVTVVPAPSVAGRIRQVKEITVCNIDTIAHTVVLQLNSGGSRRVVQKKSLLVGESFIYRPDALQGPQGATGSTGPASGSTGTPADFGLFFEGRPTPSQEIFRMTLTQAIVLDINLNGCYFSAKTPPTNDWTCTLYKDDVEIGTILLEGTTGNSIVTFATLQAFSAGDVFEIIAPAFEDATLKDITFAFAATFV